MISGLNKVYILLGGNLGDVENVFVEAINKISKHVGEVSQKSHLYSSPPWGFESENDFLNQVIEITTPRSAADLLKLTQQIELDLGRERNQNATNFESRKIDIDILYFNDDEMSLHDLVIPHYAIHERKFTLLPLVEIAPNYIHPILKMSNSALLEICKDQNPVNKI